MRAIDINHNNINNNNLNNNNINNNNINNNNINNNNDNNVINNIFNNDSLLKAKKKGDYLRLLSIEDDKLKLELKFMRLK